jgi:hypothetical protein
VGKAGTGEGVNKYGGRICVSVPVFCRNLEVELDFSLLPSNTLFFCFYLDS